jgi:hypothetical protein
MILLLIISIILLIWCIVQLVKNYEKNNTGVSIKEPENKEERNLIETPDWRGQPKSLFSCHIAGLEFHLDSMVYGGFVGYSAPEPQNPYDINAIAIYNIDGGLIGYVPRKAQGAYRSHFPDEVITYVIGYIEVDEIGKFISSAWLIRIHSFEYAKKELIRMSKIIKKRYGYEIERLNEVLEPINNIIENDAKDNDKKSEESEHV